MRTSWAGAVLTAVALLALGACGGGTDGPSTDQAPPSASQATPTAPPSGLQVALASSDLSVGLNRLVFGIIDRQSGPLRGADVEVSTFHLTQAGQEGPIETVKAVFRRWPAALGGVYTVRLSFDRPGTWGLGVVITGNGASPRTTSARFEVSETSATLAIGSPVPRSLNKTARDVERLAEMTTDPAPDPELYAMTIADALGTGKPLMLAFSTPLYCTSSTCGPQLQVVKALKERYQDRMNFIHVEVWDNPLEIEGDLSRGRLSPTVTEWNLPSEPWTFIVDGDGLVSAKFEGFVTTEGLEEAVAAVLQ